MRIKNDVIKLKECELLLRNPREEDADIESAWLLPCIRNILVLG